MARAQHQEEGPVRLVANRWHADLRGPNAEVARPVVLHGVRSSLKTKARAISTVGIARWKIKGKDVWRASIDRTLAWVRPFAPTSVSSQHAVSCLLSPTALFR
jgi:hypothetical protein